jgi:hypothetical protein
MKMRGSSVLSFLLASAFACSTLSVPGSPTAAPTSRADPRLLHFEDQWVAFDYPEGLDVYEGLDPAFKWSLDAEVDVGGEQVVGLGDAQARASGVYLRSIRITHRGRPAGGDVQQAMQDLYQAFESTYGATGPVLASPQIVIVDGARAYQTSYRIFWGEPAYDFRDVWIPHGDALYIVSSIVRWSNPDALAEFTGVVDVILRSLVIK